MLERNCWKSLRVASVVNSSKTMGGLGSVTPAVFRTGLRFLNSAERHPESSKSPENHHQARP